MTPEKEHCSRSNGRAKWHLPLLRYATGIVTEALFVILLGGFALVSVEIARWLGR